MFRSKIMVNGTPCTGLGVGAKQIVEGLASAPRDVNLVRDIRTTGTDDR